MVEMTVTELARNLRSVLDRVEFKGEEMVIVRNNHKIARIIPGSPHLTAIEAMADLYRTLPGEAATTWLEESRLPHKVSDEVSDPWNT